MKMLKLKTGIKIGTTGQERSYLKEGKNMGGNFFKEEVKENEGR
jgi:hypothetical protein